MLSRRERRSKSRYPREQPMAKLLPESVDTYEGSTRDGWRFQAKLTKYERYVVDVVMFDPSGNAFGKPYADSEDSYATLQEAQRRAAKLADELTP